MGQNNPVLLYSEQVSEKNHINPCLLCFGCMRVGKPQEPIVASSNCRLSVQLATKNILEWLENF